MIMIIMLCGVVSQDQLVKELVKSLSIPNAHLSPFL